jgi:CheY-like chemotaxis protein
VCPTAAALKFLEQGKPDLILLDVMMPAASGLELCRHVRNAPGLASLPIIILSAKSQLEEVQEGLGAGADLYLLKPVSKNELIQAVRQVLAGKAPPAQFRRDV